MASAQKRRHAQGGVKFTMQPRGLSGIHYYHGVFEIVSE